MQYIYIYIYIYIHIYIYIIYILYYIYNIYILCIDSMLLVGLWHLTHIMMLCPLSIVYYCIHHHCLHSQLYHISPCFPKHSLCLSLLYIYIYVGILGEYWFSPCLCYSSTPLARVGNKLYLTPYRITTTTFRPWCVARRTVYL